jgi:hypothetical protein
LKEKKRFTQVFTEPFPLGGFSLPENSDAGSVRLSKNKRYSIDFTPMGAGVRIVKLDSPHFVRRRSLRGELVLSSPPACESIVTNMPCRESKNAFCYSRRCPCFNVEGVVQFGATELPFIKGSAWAILDWNRWLRPQAGMRYWAAGCGTVPGSNQNLPRQIGFSVGYGSADSSQGTENAFFVDGRLHKLDQITFNVPASNWLKPWDFSSNDKRLKLTFTPSQMCYGRDNILFLQSLMRRQVFGSFSGSVLLDGGEILNFSSLNGMSELRRTRG